MQIEQLDLKTRSKIYNHTKKFLRKYQKGIVSGKLTADKFADNILTDESINSILDQNTLLDNDFKISYIDYIQKLITIQNSDSSGGKRSKSKPNLEKPSITQKVKLKKLLDIHNFNLTMPIEYLNSSDVDALIIYLDSGFIDLGNERIYNYVHTKS